MPTYLITGATGVIGRHTIAALLERGGDDLLIRATTRDPEAAQLPADPRLAPARFDFAAPATYAPALADVDAVLLIVPSVTPNVAALVAPFVEHLAARGPRRAIYLSAFGAERLPVYAPLVRQVRSADLDLTVLEPTFFASNFGHYEREGVEERGMIFQVSGDGRTAYVTPADVGRAAAAVLTGGRAHLGQTYRLTGPEALDLNAVAAEISAIRGTEVRYVAASEEAYRGALAEAGVPGFVADYMVPLYDLLRGGHVAGVSPDVERPTGRKPETPEVRLTRDFG